MGGGICGTRCYDCARGAVYSIAVCCPKVIHRPSCSNSMLKGSKFFDTMYRKWWFFFLIILNLYYIEDYTQKGKINAQTIFAQKVVSQVYVIIHWYSTKSAVNYVSPPIKGNPIFWDVLFYKSGDNQLSHKATEGRFVGAGSNRSHAAWTEFMPCGLRKHMQTNRWKFIFTYNECSSGSS